MCKTFIGCIPAAQFCGTDHEDKGFIHLSPIVLAATGGAQNKDSPELSDV
jgi:hypothetical protein